MRTDEERREFVRQLSEKGEISAYEVEEFIGRKLTDKERMELNGLNAEIKLDEMNKNPAALWALLIRHKLSAAFKLISALVVLIIVIGLKANIWDKGVSILLLLVALVLFFFPKILAMVREQSEEDKPVSLNIHERKRDG